MLLGVFFKNCRQYQLILFVGSLWRPPRLLANKFKFLPAGQRWSGSHFMPALRCHSESQLHTNTSQCQTYSVKIFELPPFFPPPFFFFFFIFFSFSHFFSFFHFVAFVCSIFLRVGGPEGLFCLFSTLYICFCCPWCQSSCDAVAHCYCCLQETKTSSIKSSLFFILESNLHFSLF